MTTVILRWKVVILNMEHGDEGGFLPWRGWQWCFLLWRKVAFLSMEHGNEDGFWPWTWMNMVMFTVKSDDFEHGTWGWTCTSMNISYDLMVFKHWTYFRTVIHLIFKHSTSLGFVLPTCFMYGVSTINICPTISLNIQRWPKCSQMFHGWSMRVG